MAADAVINLPDYTGAEITELNVVILHILYVRCETPWAV